MRLVTGRRAGRLVTGDAESTDAGESMTWTSDKPLSLIPNSPTSAIGNACAAPVSPDGLTGVGKTTVECRGHGELGQDRHGHAPGTYA